MSLLYEGKAKQVHRTDKPDEVIIRFKDNATAFNGLKKDIFSGKGRVNLAFTRYFFNELHNHGIKTHIISYNSNDELRARKVEIFPLEVVVRNYAAGSICKRENYEKGFKFDPPMSEFFLKDDSKGDPLMNEPEILAAKLATREELDTIKNITLKINSVLSDFLDKKGITLVDFKLEFGKTSNGEILLADEISPDTCRFWKKGTMDSLDKDVYREGKGNLIDSYMNLAEILGVQI